MNILSIVVPKKANFFNVSLFTFLWNLTEKDGPPPPLRRSLHWCACIRVCFLGISTRGQAPVEYHKHTHMLCLWIKAHYLSLSPPTTPQIPPPPPLWVYCIIRADWLLCCDGCLPSDEAEESERDIPLQTSLSLWCARAECCLSRQPEPWKFNAENIL